MWILEKYLLQLKLELLQQHIRPVPKSHSAELQAGIYCVVQIQNFMITKLKLFL